MPDRRSDMMMPVDDDHVLKLAEIEAQRLIVDNLRRLNDGQKSTVEALGEIKDSLHGIDVRLVRIESNSVSVEVSELKAKVDALESDRDKRAGAIGAAEWGLRYGPILLGFIVLAVIVLIANNKLSL